MPKYWLNCSFDSFFFQKYQVGPLFFKSQFGSDFLKIDVI